MYIADSGNNRIRVVAYGSNVIFTCAGTGAAGIAGDGGPATSAQLNTPLGIAIDGQGRVYIADKVRRLPRG